MIQQIMDFSVFHNKLLELRSHPQTVILYILFYIKTYFIEIDIG